MKKILPLVIIIFHSYFVYPQQDTIKVKTRKYNKVASYAFELGYMLGNGSTLGDKMAAKSKYRAYEARLGFKLNNLSDVYNQVYRFPIMGIGFYASTFDEPEIGTPNALFYYFNIPVRFERNKHFTMSYIGAFGLSYNFHPFDSVNNPSDVFIGSYNNCYFNFSMLFNYHFNPNWVADFYLGIKHFSNGSFKQPNYGINLLLAGIGVSYRPNSLAMADFQKNIPKFIRHNQYNIALLVGSKNYTAGKQNYLKTGLSINWLRALGYKYRGGFGLDVYYSPKSGPRNDTETTFSNSMSCAVVGSWEWALTRKLYVPIAFGVYLKRNEINGEQTPYYERVGMRYRLNNHLFAGVTIKAHKGVADFFEWTVGYSIFNDPNHYNSKL
ncbi:MAG: hypothetical protein ACOYN4_13435 [Bacteroidales bacterium]